MGSDLLQVGTQLAQDLQRHLQLALGEPVEHVVRPTLAAAVWPFAVWWVVLVAVFTALAVRRYRLG